MGKKILFLANPHMSLYKEIQEELINQGHNVYTILDRPLAFDPFFNVAPLKNIIKKIGYKIFNPFKRYWITYIKEEHLLSAHYDIFFCIEGYSLNEELVNHLKKRNPNIKCILYLWDSSSHYNYFRHIHYFDRIFTFDRIDAIKYNVSFLPLFWKKHETQKSGNKFSISSIGTNHDDRTYIIKRVVNQLEKLNIKNHYIKIISPQKKHSLLSVIRYYAYMVFERRNIAKIEELQLEFNKQKPDFCLTKFIPSNDYYNIMYNSSIILDTDRPNQNGLSSRFIWALSLNKKIITTNTDIANYHFYNPKQIFIINRKNPIVSEQILNSQDESFNSSDHVIHLRLDNWIKTILQNTT